MDTRFWGPSGWKLLHSVAYSYPKKPTFDDKRNYGIFFNNLKNVLPCKYCRISLKKFIKNLPIEPYLSSRNKLRTWIYHIHNKVNNKLRRQKLLKTPNPKLKEVDKMYREILKKKCELRGWDFIYCIAFNYPKKKNSVSIEKMQHYITFFKLLGEVIPCKKYRKLYNQALSELPVEKYIDSRKNLTHWLHLVNCRINESLSEKNKKYKLICSNYESRRAGACKKKNYRGKKTCQLSRNDLKKIKTIKRTKNNKITKQSLFTRYIS